MKWGLLTTAVMLLGSVCAYAAPQGTFTVQPGQAGFYGITDSLIQTATTQQTEATLQVNVLHHALASSMQPDPAVYTVLKANASFEFDVFLGYLDEGDSVKVAFADNSDAVATPAQFKYQITKQTAIPVSVLHEDAKAKPREDGLGQWTLTVSDPVKNATLQWDVPTDDAASFAVRGNVLLTYQVPQSGTYALHDAWVDAQRVELQIQVGDHKEPLRKIAINGRTRINTDLGYMAKGQKVLLRFSTTLKAANVKLDATVAEWAVRRAPLRVSRGEDGLLNAYEPDAPRKAIDIPAPNWITVKPQNEDATEVIRQAIMDAIKAQTSDNYVGIRLERGKTYTVASKQIGGNLFEIKEANHFVFDGNGATLVMNSPEIQRKGVNFFTVDRSQKIVLADMTITGDLLPYCTGMITDINPPKGDTQTVTFKLLPGSPDPLKEIARNGHAHGYAYDAKIPGRLAEGVWSFFPGSGDHNLKATDTPDVFTHTVTRTAGTIRVGSKWLIKNKKAGTTYLVTRGGSEDVTMWKFDCQASGGGLLRNWATDAVNILDTTLKPIGDRTISTTSDGIHGRGREGVWVENLFISGICEDIMNTYARTMGVAADDNPDDNIISLRLSSRSGDGRVRKLVPLSAGDTPQVGDKLLFFNPNDGNVIGYANVTAIDAGRFTLSNALPGVDTWDKGSDVRATMVYNMQAAARFVVRDSTFADSMRYAVYIKAPHAMIFNNLFEGLASPPVYAANEPGWPEGPPPSHLWIQGNRFNQCNFSYMSRNRAFLNVDPAMISIYTRRFQTKDDPNDYRAFVTHGQYANSHVKIIGNTFENWRGMGISVRNARSVFISDNHFTAPVEDSVMRQTMSKDPILMDKEKGRYTSIYLDSINGAIIKDNTYTGLPEGDRKIGRGEDVTHVMQD